MNDHPSPGAPSTAYVDLAAVESNVRVLREHAPTAQLLAVVKADGYGHGLLPCARAAQRGGATWLGTAQLGEAVTLRDSGVEGRLLSWLHVPGTRLRRARSPATSTSPSRQRWALDEVAAAARALGRTARIHVKVDTGLGRNGAFGADFADLLARGPSARGRGSRAPRRALVALRVCRPARPPDGASPAGGVRVRAR